MTILEIALALAEQGIPVFPCLADKSPACANGFNDAVIHPADVRALFAKAGKAAALIGVPTGKASGFDVLDIDTRKGGRVWEEANKHRLPDTRMHRTPGLPKPGAEDQSVQPGQHYLFLHLHNVRNINDGKSIAQGVDVKADRGYVCFPPCGGYEVINQTEIAPWPDWLRPIVVKAERPPAPKANGSVPKVTVSEKRVRGVINREIRTLRATPSGGLHAARWKVSSVIGGVLHYSVVGMSDQEVEAVLIAAKPPEADEEKERRAIRDGLAFGRANPIDLNSWPDKPGYERRSNGHAKPNGEAHAMEGDEEPVPGSPEFDAKWKMSREEDLAASNARHDAMQAAVDARKELEKTIEAFPGWQKLLHTDSRGRVYRNLSNTMIALSNAPPWEGVFGWNEFAERTEVLKYLPCGPAGMVPRELSNFDISNTTAWLQQNAVDVSSAIAHEAIKAVADENRFHPVRAYLHTLVWDGKPRINHWLQDHLGAEDTVLNRAIGSKWLIGLVARVMRPGCQFDTALIAESKQGRGKSSAFRVLADPWFTDEMPDLSQKDALQQLHGVWVVELAELDSIRKQETSKIKAFLSARVDRYRVPWERVPVDVPRQNGFCGTVNPSEATGYLRDETGARRFWCVACAVGWDVGREVDVAALAAVRDQLWAEAIVRFKKEEAWHLETVDLQTAQAEAAEERQEDDPRERRIRNFVRGRDEVHMADILEFLDIPVDRWTRGLRTEIGNVMHTLKWRRKRITNDKKERDFMYLKPLV